MRNEFTRIAVLNQKSISQETASTAVSLHAHTCFSKEDLSFIPQYVSRIPVLALLYQHGMQRNIRLYGKSPDFKRGYWIPPVSPTDVYRSECTRIRQRLGLQPLVSITDHDDIEATRSLKRRYPNGDIPISIEWTVPYGGRILHIGVHNLAPAEATDIAGELVRFQTSCRPHLLGDLLQWVNRCPETLVVLNHPFCDLVEFEIRHQKELAVQFLNRYGEYIHALEINGYRSWRENRLAMKLAQKYGLPAVSGGDRHCWSPNAVLNLTRARTFADFVAEVRYAKTSRILVMPGYLRNLVVREMEAFGDFFRTDRRDPKGHKRWKERVVYRMENGCEHSLIYYWRRYLPLWVKLVLWIASLVENRYIQLAARAVLPGKEPVAV
jgi:hypothetical protein